MQQHPGKLFPLPAVLLIDFLRLRKEMPDRNKALKLVVTVQRRAAAPEAFSLKIVLFFTKPLFKRSISVKILASLLMFSSTQAHRFLQH